MSKGWNMHVWHRILNMDLMHDDLNVKSKLSKHIDECEAMLQQFIVLVFL